MEARKTSDCMKLAQQFRAENSWPQIVLVGNIYRKNVMYMNFMQSDIIDLGGTRH